MNNTDRRLLRKSAAVLRSLADMFPSNPCDIAALAIMARATASVGLKLSQALDAATDEELGGMESAGESLRAAEEQLKEFRLEIMPARERERLHAEPEGRNG